MNNPLEVPQADSDDVAHIAATTILGLIPFVGAADLFKFIFTPSVEKRRDRWMQVVAEAITELQSQNQFSIESLRDNDEFITLLIQASGIAFKTHIEAKHLQLKAALKNSVNTELSFDCKQLYFNFIDRFTPSHLIILSLIKQHNSHTAKITSSRLLYKKLVELAGIKLLDLGEVIFAAMLEELHRSGLLVISLAFKITDGDVEVFESIELDKTSRVPQINVTGLAEHFLWFIEEK